jgi:hypothetical protein
MRTVTEIKLENCLRSCYTSRNPQHLFKFVHCADVFLVNPHTGSHRSCACQRVLSHAYEEQHASTTTTARKSGMALRGLDLPVLRARVTLRLLEDITLPSYKGALLRAGFGYAFQRSCYPQVCWGASDRCAVDSLCPYRWVFETPHPPDVRLLHDLQDVPRPFVIELPPPTSGRTPHPWGHPSRAVLPTRVYPR